MTFRNRDWPRTERPAICENYMKVVGITMITDPEYRQDPFIEAVIQATTLCDELVVVYGKKSDKTLIIEKLGQGTYVKDGMSDEFSVIVNGKKVYCLYLHWPQPEWTYDELARHLNLGVEKALALEPDWILKFDSDYIFHEQDADSLRGGMLRYLPDKNILALTIEKKQFFMPNRYYEKGKIPIVVRALANMRYGKIKEKYSDLCQPIIWDMATTVKLEKAVNSIPEGRAITSAEIKSIGGFIYNYDYTFKTLERATELLYHFDRSHAKFWGAGYSGRKLQEISPESALNDYLGLLGGRIKKCNKTLGINDHPKAIQARILALEPNQMGFNLWGKINIPVL